MCNNKFPNNQQQTYESHLLIGYFSQQQLTTAHWLTHMSKSNTVSSSVTNQQHILSLFMFIVLYITPCHQAGMITQHAVLQVYAYVHVLKQAISGKLS